MHYSKTEAGKIELHARAAGLTPFQRQVLILCDSGRDASKLMAMMPPDTLKPALERLVSLGLLTRQGHATPQETKPAEVELTESDRFRAIVELATVLAMDLGFAARVKAQLQIERASTVADLNNVVTLLCSQLTEKHKDTPLMSLRLNKLRQLAAG